MDYLNVLTFISMGLVVVGSALGFITGKGMMIETIPMITLIGFGLWCFGMVMLIGAYMATIILLLVH